MGCSCSRDLASELILAQERTGMACLGICNDRGLGEQARQASARDRAGMAPALPSPPGAFVTEAIFPRVTKPPVQEHPRSARCAALHVIPAHQPGPQPLPPHLPGSRAGSAGQHQPPLCSSSDQSLWDQPPPHHEQFWGAQGPRPCPEGLGAPRGEHSSFKAGFNMPLIQVRDEK